MEPNASIPPDNTPNTPPLSPEVPTNVMPSDPPVTPPSTTAVPTTKDNKKKYIIIAIIITVLFLAAGAVVASIVLKKDSSKSSNSVNTTEDTKKSDVAEEKANPNEIANCLRPEDYLAVRDKESLPKYYDKKTESTSVSESIFFQPNSTNYEYPNQIETFDKYAEFYKKNKSKSWKFELRGQIKDVDGSGNNAANKKLANDRAQKVKSELVNRGFDEGRITILEPEVYSGELGANDSDRNVSMYLKSQCIKE